MPCAPVDGMDPVVVAESVKEAVDEARKGDGPTFLEMKTYRFKGTQCLMHKNTVPKMRLLNIKRLIPFLRYSTRLRKINGLRIRKFKPFKTVKATVKEAVDFAESSFPSNDSLYQNVYAEEYPFIKE